MKGKEMEKFCSCGSEIPADWPTCGRLDCMEPSYQVLLNNGDSMNVAAGTRERAWTVATEYLRGTGIEILEIHG